MKNDFRKAITEEKPQLAIIKRIDDLPAWKKPADNKISEQKFEPVFEIRQKKDRKNKKKQEKNTFRNWNLPIQPQGYIKPRANDLL